MIQQADQRMAQPHQRTTISGSIYERVEAAKAPHMVSARRTKEARQARVRVQLNVLQAGTEATSSYV